MGVSIAVVIDGKTIQLVTDASDRGQAQSTLQSLQNLQGTPPMSNNYTQSGRQTGSQQSVNLNNDKQETAQLAALWQIARTLAFIIPSNALGLIHRSVTT